MTATTLQSINRSEPLGLAVALLAAGRSTRFGAPNKLTAQLGDRPLIAWAAQAGRALGADHHFLVAAADLQFDAEGAGYTRLLNTDAEQGMATSLQIAAQAAQDTGASALLIMLADMPFIRQPHLHRLIEIFRTDGARPIFSCTPGGSPQPPALFPAAFFPALRGLEGDRGARALARNATLLDCDAGQLRDVDTAEDLEAARKLIESPHSSG